VARKRKPLVPKKKIEIGGLDYKFKYYSKAKKSEGHPDDPDYDPNGVCAGFADLSEREIAIYTELGRDEEGFTILHELLHASLDACRMGEKTHEEALLRPLSRILWGAVKAAGLVDRKFL
jgi:hypothetical protein